MPTLSLPLCVRGEGHSHTLPNSFEFPKHEEATGIDFSRDGSLKCGLQQLRCSYYVKREWMAQSVDLHQHKIDAMIEDDKCATNPWRKFRRDSGDDASAFPPIRWIHVVLRLATFLLDYHHKKP